MNDFDQFFRDRLGGERSFPRREKNWRQMSRRLDAFQAGARGGPGGRRLRFWQAAGVVAVAVSSWLFWQNRALRTENEALREQVAALQTPPTTAPVPNAGLESFAPQPAAPAAETSAAGQNLLRKQADFSATTDITLPKSAGRRDLTASTKSFSAEKTALPEDSPAEKTVLPGAAAPGAAPSSPGSANKSAQPNEPPAVPSPAVPSAVLADKAPQPSDISPVPTPDGLPAVLADSAAATASRIDSLQGPVAPRPAPDSAAVAPQPDTTTATPAPATIHPVPRPARFRVGVQASIGWPVPGEKGISLLTGQGLTAEVRLWRTLWAGISADWLRFEISADRNPPRFHLPETPFFDPFGGPPGHDYELTRVECSHRQQRYALGLRYALPLRGWLRPSLRVAHVWAQSPPAFVSYRFEDLDQHGGGGPHGNHPPEYFTQRSENQWFSNVWRFGAGLDVETKRWTFGLSADYDKSMASSDPLFDALLLRAGAAYKF